MYRFWGDFRLEVQQELIQELFASVTFYGQKLLLLIYLGISEMPLSTYNQTFANDFDQTDYDLFICLDVKGSVPLILSRSLFVLVLSASASFVRILFSTRWNEELKTDKKW